MESLGEDRCRHVAFRKTVNIHGRQQLRKAVPILRRDVQNPLCYQTANHRRRYSQNGCRLPEGENAFRMQATRKLRGYLKRAFPFPGISGDTRGNGSLDWFSGHRVHSASMYQDARQRGVSILFKTGAVDCDGLRAADLRGYRLFLLRISADGSWN